MVRVKPIALLTGGTGFIGENLSKYLSSLNFEIAFLNRQIKTGLEGQTFLYELKNDESGSQLIQIIDSLKPDVVFHLASLYLAEHRPEDIDALIESNVKFGTKLLEAISLSSFQTPVVFAGTGWQIYSESDNSPVNLYAATKSAFTEIARYYSSAKKMRTAELRLFDTYGQGDPRKKIIQLLMEKAESESAEKIDFSPGEQRLSLLHVNDVVDAFYKTYMWLDEQPEGTFKSFQARNEATYSLKEIAKIIEGVTGKPIAINWGGRNYRMREVMTPYSNLPSPPNWAPRIGLDEGLTLYWKSLRESK